ncbi:hypothetical protein DFP92_104192 [Yoonia sediminilitoris]|uniref:Uncharacterized protein n=1 Tax=Yoonia sediminilitoris TaxID=1286148 RepID=A0A2T6KIN0_9RHOB|nr:hypothetical protein C8N45_104193 [Yoonia sediminilitoris]RCW96182.1 hypothetical protein DFP92_104192 [Yoonia sediminilitoris]
MVEKPTRFDGPLATHTHTRLISPVEIAVCSVIMTGLAIRAILGGFSNPIADDFGWLQCDFSLTVAISLIGLAKSGAISVAQGRPNGFDQLVHMGVRQSVIRTLYNFLPCASVPLCKHAKR